MNNLIVRDDKESKIILLEQLLETMFTKNTKRVYKNSINKFLDHFKIGINEIQNINAGDIINYIKYLKPLYANNSLNVMIASLKSLYNKLDALDICKNVFVDLKKIKVQTNFKSPKNVKVESIVTLEETKKILDYLSKYKGYSYRRNFVLVKMLYNTGCRITELLELKFEDIKPEADHWKAMITGKGHKEREIMIDNDTYLLFCDLRPGKKGHVFTVKKGTKLSYNSIYNTIRKLGDKLLHKHVSPHSFRHSFATIKIKETNDVKGVSNYLGHSSTAITLDMYCQTVLEFNQIYANAA